MGGLDVWYSISSIHVPLGHLKHGASVTPPSHIVVWRDPLLDLVHDLRRLVRRLRLEIIPLRLRPSVHDQLEHIGLARLSSLSRFIRDDLHIP